MKNVFLFVYLSLIVLASGCAFGQSLPAYKWTATIKVVNEDGNPISAADVSVQYTILPPPPPGQPTYGEIKGLTDNNGVFTASHTDSSWTFGVTVDKAGYYNTHIGHDLYQPGQLDDKAVAASRNSTITLVLKKIGHPIAMYAKKEETKMPKENEPIGFDLMVGDWVGPYGTGKTADIFFTVHRNIISPQKFDADLEITFPNAGDGIVVVPPASDTGVSRLVMPHSAEEAGYQPTLKWSYHNFSETSEPASGYFLRVRTVLDSNGNVESALFGKIQGDVRFLVGTKAPQAGIAFTYYLNPTPNDRNVEFDQSQNLFGGLPFDEQVKAP
jgi:hypothetical protein